MMLKRKGILKYLAGASVLSAALLLGACGNESAPEQTNETPGDNNQVVNETPAPADELEEVTLVMSMWNAGIEFTALADAFQERYPHITIDMIDISTDNYVERIVTMLAGGERLDIITNLDMALYVNLAERGQLKDLTDFVQTIDRTNFGDTLDFMNVDGNGYFGIPYRWHFWALFYNKDLFDAAGIPYPEHITWEEYRQLALDLTSGTGNDKVYGAHLHTWRSITHGVATAQTGNTQLTDDFYFLQDQIELVLAMQEEGSIMDFGTILAGSVGYRPRFEMENAAMIPMGTWYLGELAERAEFRWGVAPLPQISLDAEITTIGNPTSFSVGANTAHPEEALRFIEFATGAEGAKIIAGIGNVPAYMTDEILDIYFSFDGMPQDELTRRTFSPDRAELEIDISSLTGEIDQILAEIHELIMVREITVEEGIQQMNDRVGAALRR